MLVLNSYPKRDIHGETTDTCVFVINDFINDNYKMKNKYVLIIHGKGSGALKKKTHEVLRNNKLVENFELDVMNLGQTVVKIKEKKSH